MYFIKNILLPHRYEILQSKFIKLIVLVLFTFFILILSTTKVGAATDSVNLIIFEREGCTHCKAENNFLNKIKIKNLTIIHKDIKDPKIRIEFESITKKYGLPLATPVTLIGNAVISGFDTQDTTGKNILEKIAIAQSEKNLNFTITHYLATANEVAVSELGSSCKDKEKCEIDTGSGISVSKQEKFSLFGWNINIKDMGLFSIATILGIIDGFNPCAMWVLLTFLIALSQIGNRRKMAQIVGLFIIAETVMYFLILNIWYQTWDFIKLDSFVTPAIGLFSIGAGFYFLHKWHKTKGQVTCDVTSSEHQSKVVGKIQDIAKKPMTIAVVFGVLALAFSVNIIEFACSVGIPQTFTKVLEINNLNFITRQFYIMIYTTGYMLDDIIVFALALWGYKSFAGVGAKYSHLSILFAGVLMVLLGIMLVFFRDILIL